MLRSIKITTDDQQTEIVAKFESIISELVKKEVATALKPLQEKISLQDGSISDLERCTNEHSDQLIGMQANIIKLSATVESLSKKCEELEVRSRWHNVWLVGLPEGTKGPQPTEFIAKLSMDMLGLDGLPGLDRAHCTLRAKPKEGEPPRLMVIRVTQFQMRNAILCHAGQSSPLLHNRKRMHIFPDFTPTVAKRRTAFAQVKRELHACANAKFGLRYPATLHITMSDGQIHRFEDPDQAQEFVNKRLKKNTAPESD
ncbi:hypothetical protein D5F01_LYC19153 [Larimichthys crocea]|uniref:LINE-1 type transposase domain-containing protein 1 n=1 Tax=Larimichthys crocea TaxID=215358 RepID=A0A6G0HRG7_LARCR|nr:hypothetical protein D5F01_LYC19153 [Larimichthys crocea]